MKGIYLTQEGKQEIEAKIAELDKLALDEDKPSFRMGQKIILLEILSLATILPVEESWCDIQNTVVSIKQLPFSYTEEYYPNGVIIQPKQ